MREKATQRDTGERPHEDRGREWSDGATNQRMLGPSQKLKDAKKNPPLELLEVPGPADILILDS